MQHRRVHQRCFELTFHLVELLMAGVHKAGDTARRKLHTKQIMEQLAGAHIGHGLSLDQRDRQRLDTSAILDCGFDSRWKRRSGQMSALGALLFFHVMLRDPEPLGRQVDHLATLRNGSWARAQIPLTV
jgi:hypothetical protein